MQDMTIDAVIFDMDGLLFDTEAIGRWAWAQALADHGFELTDAVYRQFIGRDMRHREAVLRETFGPAFPLEAVKARRLAVGDEREVREGVPMKPGALELLATLAALGMPLGLATGTRRSRALRRLEQAGITHHFRAIVAGDEVQNGKPAPDIYLAVSRALAVPPERCLVFEDAAAGIVAASAAGMRPVMIPDLEPPAPETTRLARCVLPSLAQAVEALPELIA